MSIEKDPSQKVWRIAVLILSLLVGFEKKGSDLLFLLGKGFSRHIFSVLWKYQTMFLTSPLTPILSAERVISDYKKEKKWQSSKMTNYPDIISFDFGVQSKSTLTCCQRTWPDWWQPVVSLKSRTKQAIGNLLSNWKLKMYLYYRNIYA